MSDTSPEKSGNELTVEQWLQVRKDEGLIIDPQTAEVTWSFEYTVDPYGVHPDIPDDLQQVGREYFARRPGSDVWVHFSDLPDETHERLWTMYGSRLASFVVSPAGVIWNNSEPLTPLTPVTADRAPGLR